MKLTSKYYFIVSDEILSQLRKITKEEVQAIFAGKTDFDWEAHSVLIPETGETRYFNSQPVKSYGEDS